MDTGLVPPVRLVRAAVLVIGSDLDASILGLVAVLTAAVPADPDFRVFDGRPAGSPPRKYVCVGWEPTPGQPGAVIGPVTGQDDDIAVTCLLSVFEGSIGAASTRAEACGLFDRFAAAIQKDRTLGGRVLTSMISGADFIPDPEVQGVLVQIRFTVAVRGIS